MKSSLRFGKRPIWPDPVLPDYIQPVAEKGGIGRIGWHTFRHSLTSWGKLALSIEETRELARHADIQTTSNIYGGLSLEVKRAAQERLVGFVHNAAKKPPESTALRNLSLTIRG